MFCIERNGIVLEYNREELKNNNKSENVNLKADNGKISLIELAGEEYTEKYKAHQIFFPDDKKEYVTVYEDYIRRYTSYDTYLGKSGQYVLVLAGLCGIGVSTLGAVLGSAATIIGGYWTFKQDCKVAYGAVEQAWKRYGVINDKSYNVQYKKQKCKFVAKSAYASSGKLEPFDVIKDPRFDNLQDIIEKSISWYYQEKRME